MKGCELMPKVLDITGQRFGSLTALKKVKSRGGKTYWLCQCDCGNQKEIQTSHLTSGATKSCGCQRKNPLTEIEEEKICILCGEKFIANNYNRLYCYKCSPKGLSANEAIKFKKRQLKNKLIEYKGGKCQKCGYNKCKGALHFHHRNPNQKDFSISHINLNDTNFSFENILKEIDKCDLLCANCHAEEHYLED